jgi:hypothetical protein
MTTGFDVCADTDVRQNLRVNEELGTISACTPGRASHSFELYGLTEHKMEIGLEHVPFLTGRDVDKGSRAILSRN